MPSLPLGASQTVTIEELRDALVIVAKLVADDPVYIPIFERLEAELKAMETADPVERARQIIALHRAHGA